MAAVSDASRTQTDRQNALHDIQFASILDPDLTPSEDETPEEKQLQLEDAQSAIGVSIGQQQTRLTSPKTPAAEKAAALDEAGSDALFDGWQQSLDGAVEQSTQPSAAATRSEDDDPERLGQRATERAGGDVRWPSPWRAQPQTFQRVDDHRAVLRDSLKAGHRRRALSGGSTADAFRKYIPFNLPSMPSMPKSSSFLSWSIPSFNVSPYDYTRARQSGNASPRRRVTSVYGTPPYGTIAQHDGSNASRTEMPPSSTTSRPHHTSSNSSSSPMTPEEPVQELHRRTTPQLRRSNSEGSLLVYRTKSFASSLGDDTRFEHVQEQVNSRLKAIKDSWQDANFKLPSLPTMPNFSFGSRDDLFKSRSGSGSTTPKMLNVDNTSPAANNRVSFLANSNISSRSTSMRMPEKDSAHASAGMSGATAASHPHFNKAVQELSGDVVILGGYRGSILRSAEPPHRQLWAPVKVGLNLRKVDLEVGLNPEDEEKEEERIIPDGMLTHIGPVDIAKRLFKRLRSSENARDGSLRVHNYGYDWRLSPHILSRRLIEYLRTLPCNQPDVPPEKRGAIVIAHSLGGLITRHAINQCPDLVQGVIYAGVPKTCVNILGPLRNGDDVLLSSRVLTAQVNFSIRTSYVLLPLDGKCFINKDTKEEYPVDFFDPEEWVKYSLSPCAAPALPAPTAPTLLNPSSLLNAMSQAISSRPGRRLSISRLNGGSRHSTTTSRSTQETDTISPVRAGANVAAHAADKVVHGGTGIGPQMTNSHAGSAADYPNSQSNPATHVTIPHDKAMKYLTRTLAEVKKFKQELNFREAHQKNNAYPPIALIYGKSTPTVYGAKVESREAIKRTDAYDELAFASGDGVVLARAAMVPEGYSVVRGGVVSSERGHVTLLGDLEAVGRCITAVMLARKNGVGLGNAAMKEDKGKQKA
ncbi:hypothetical protein BDV96DRAFT_641862 [Lophiotrema nucula]|uniref:Uncharacterized protein n=1 Tax=Lophiotrema nucula TaxID=690887 RepID=A0A6A5ZP52_9PLEO|nr:hypothetical protein BDV96DRAFT_641862 [Lophiotrema nucula]